MVTTPKKPKLYWINPLTHYCYDGWLRFFEEISDLEVHDEKNIPDLRYKNHHVLKYEKTFHNSKTYFSFYRNLPVKKDGIAIVGDFLNMSMCYTLRIKHKIIYAEIPVLESAFKKFMFRFLLLFLPKKFIVFSRKTQELLEHYGKKVLFLPALYTGEIKKNRALTQKKLKILYVGLIQNERKNLGFVLDLLKDFKGDFEIGLAGKPQVNDLDLDHYQEYFGEKMVMHGFVDHKKLSEIYSSYNVFIMPSKKETFGMVIFEAMAHGLPILVSDQAAASDYIEDGENGYRCPLDKEVFLEKLSLLSDQKLRKKMGEKSTALVRDKYWLHNDKLKQELEDEFKQFVYD